MQELTTLQKALLAIKKLEHLLQAKPQNTSEPIAIIGLACRFPQVNNKYEYWQLLRDGGNIISHFPEERWQKLSGTNENTLRDSQHPYWGGFLANIADFDAYFFGITPREATRMDPQQRQLLEVAYEAIEDAGIPTDAFVGSNTGVFTSLYGSQFLQLLTLDNEMDALYIPTGNASSIAANRLSYLLDLRGASMVLDTACSSSLVAAHLACLHIQNKLCDMAFVCGANINLLPSMNFLLAKAKMLSPDGQCKTFSAAANGYVQGEGSGVIILKSLTKALQDKNRIYAVIAGGAINQDGKTNGLTAPNGAQQEALLQSAYTNAHIDLQKVSYVECHGTGTFLGDPIEAEAIGNVLGKNRLPENPCWIGSVKTNIGHLEPAAGIASLIKVALALQHSKIPPHLNFSAPNPHIAFDKYNLQVPRQLEDWPTYGDYRIAGISGFGFGGTNAHLILRETSTQERNYSASNSTTSKTELFTLSAKDSTALTQLISAWHQYLENNSTLNLAQLCYNTHVRRTHYPYRVAIVANSLFELSVALRKILKNNLQNSEKIFITTENTAAIFTPIDNFSEFDATALGQMYVNQAKIDWQKYEENRWHEHFDMPLYPWQKKSYWPETHSIKSEAKNAETTTKYPYQGEMLSSPLAIQQFEFTFSTNSMPELRDTYNVLHAGFYLEMLAFSVKTLQKKNNFSIQDLSFSSLMIAPDDTDITVQVIIEKKNNNSTFTFYSKSQQQSKWSIHAKGKLLFHTEAQSLPDSIVNVQKRCQQSASIDSFYERIIKMQMPAGGSIRWAQEYWLGKKEILCKLARPSIAWSDESFILKIHPGIFDGCIQSLFLPLPEHLMTPYVASSIAEIQFYDIKNPPAYVLTTLKSIAADGAQFTGDWYLIDKNYEIIAKCADICMTQLNDNVKTHIDRIIKIRTQNNTNLATGTATNQRESIINFLIEQIAIIFSMPTTDVKINKSLSEMGIDSLMALVLINSIESNLEKSITLQALLDGPTIAELANTLLDDSQPSTAPSSEQLWIAYRQQRATAKARLFCFPYGGGGASIYKDWQNDLPDTIEVCPIQLPGKEYRIDEKAIIDMDTLINTLIDNIQSELNLPFAVFGHSFGALLAFEFARALRKRNLPTPIHLFAAAFPDPRNPTHSLDNLLLQLQDKNIDLFALENPAVLAKLKDDELNQIAQVFSENGLTEYADHQLSAEIIKILLPLFISDMRIVKKYRHHEEPALNLPITVFSGKRDLWVSSLEQLTWSTHTTKKFAIYEFDSDHLFIKNNKIKQSILKRIAKAFVSTAVRTPA